MSRDTQRRRRCPATGSGARIDRRSFLLASGAMAFAGLGAGAAEPGPPSAASYGPVSPFGYMHTALVDIKAAVRSLLVPFFEAHAQFTADLQRRTGQLFEVLPGYARPRGANFVLFKEDVSPVEDPARFAVMRGRPGGSPPEQWKDRYPYVTPALLPGHTVPMFSFFKALGPKLYPTGYGVAPALTGLRRKWGLGGKYRQLMAYHVPAGEAESAFAKRFIQSTAAIVNEGHLSAQPFQFLVSREIKRSAGQPTGGQVDMDGREWTWGRYVMFIETNVPRPVATTSDEPDPAQLKARKTDDLVILRALQPKCFWDGVI